MQAPAIISRTIRLNLIATMLLGFACDKRIVDPGSNEPVHWTNFTIANQSGDTLRMSFNSQSQIGLDGGTLFEKTAHTICNIDDTRPDGSHSRFLTFSFPGNATGVYSFDGGSTSTMVELTVPGSPLVFLPVAGLHTATVSIQEYGAAGETISGDFSYRVRRLAISDTVQWNLTGSFAVLRNPNNTVDSLSTASD